MKQEGRSRASAAGLVALFLGTFAAGPAMAGQVKAGVGVVDMTWNVGSCSGQYCDEGNSDAQALVEGGEVDPYFHHRIKEKSYGVQSRLSARAIVVEGANGKRIALLKTDNYLAQDMLVRRVGQILDEGTSGVHYDDILYHVTHNHSSPYYATLSFGVWVFQDVYDQRMFEFQARKMAEAIEKAAANLKPARVGATTVRHTIYKGNVVRLATADDGTPAGYPLEYNDHGLVVMRFDDMTDPANPKPLAVWINWGEHPESLDGYGLDSGDYMAPLERFVERDIGAALVFSQGDVGSSENSGNKTQLLDDDGNLCGSYPEGGAENRGGCVFGEGTLRDWNHQGYVQTERNVRFLADAIVEGWGEAGAAGSPIPFSTDFTVDRLNAWVPGPLSHPYPSVSNCRTETTVKGNPGVPVLGLPDCFRDAETFFEPLLPLFGGVAPVYDSLKAAGVPIPDHYDFPAFEGVEENVRLRLQAFRLGDMLLASCACEAQNDLILNLESRTDTQSGNIYDGFDWACLLPEHSAEAVCQQQLQYYNPTEFPTGIPGSTASADAISHLRAQVHNDAAGWDAPENAITANSEPTDPSEIWGNFTKEEIQDLGIQGYALPVGVGHAGDYNGYTVSYREYMNRDSYRKALTSYGPHTADYMATRLVRMAGALKGGPALAPELDDPIAQADEVRQVAMATALGKITSAAYDTYLSALPDDVGPAAALEQPKNIQRFDAATFSWRGGSNAVDNPTARVERLVDGQWQPYADMSGEVQTMVHLPEGAQGVIDTYTGAQEWRWTANFEAYDSFPSRLSRTPDGTYRFVVDGAIRQGSATTPYHLESQAFAVSPWTGIAVANAQVTNGTVTFTVPPIRYPRSYVSPFPFIQDNGDQRICDQCTFRPWARDGKFARADVGVAGGDPSPVQCATSASGETNCSAAVSGSPVTIQVYDTFGETSGPVVAQ